MTSRCALLYSSLLLSHRVYGVPRLPNLISSFLPRKGTTSASPRKGHMISSFTRSTFLLYFMETALSPFAHMQIRFLNVPSPVLAAVLFGVYSKMLGRFLFADPMRHRPFPCTRCRLTFALIFRLHEEKKLR